MAISQWKPGTLYIPGSLVVPTTVVGAASTDIPNADFEGGDTGWTKDTGWAINSNQFFSGAIAAEYSGPGAGNIVSATKHVVEPGTSITASCFIQHGASADGEANGAVILRWYTGADVFISDSTGNSVSTGAAGVWRKSTVIGIAPPTAGKVVVGVSAYNDWAALYADDLQWNYVASTGAAVLAYKAIDGGGSEAGSSSYTGTDISFGQSFGGYTAVYRQIGSWKTDGFVSTDGNLVVSGSVSNDDTYGVSTVTDDYISVVPQVTTAAAGPSITVSQVHPGGSEGTLEAGTSGVTEPTWPLAVGDTVVDGTVVWEAVGVDSVTWKASSILTSGSSEPTWPTGTGDFVSDNNIAWQTVPMRIEDENCPNTKVVAIAASKVFAGDTDVTRFCATLNARDWTTQDDAGFLPTGLQQKSQVGVSAMGVYRGNLAIWSPSTFQVWQVDPDPAAMALLDAMEGIGSMYQQAVQPVSDDLFFLSALGVRTVGIAEGTNNLASGDAGVPIDTLVQTEMYAVDVEPVASYYPGAGQFWLAFRPLTLAATLLAGQFLLTSTLYPVEFYDGLESAGNPEHAIEWLQPEDRVQNSSYPVKGYMAPSLNIVEFDDSLQNSSHPSFGTYAGGLVEYLNDDSVQNGGNPVSGLLWAALISYYHPEPAESLINQTATAPVKGIFL